MSRPDLKVSFCGFQCENPFLLAASPVSRFGEMIERAFRMGWAGAVTKSVSLAQDLPDHSLSPRFAGIGLGGSGLTAPYKGGLANIDFRIDQSVEKTMADYALLKSRYPDKFLAISLKAEFDQKQWQHLAGLATAAGADAIELCLSCPDPCGEGGSCAGGSIGQNPQSVKEVVTWVQSATYLPVMVKLSAHVANLAAIGLAAQEGGAAALTAINTLKSISGIDLATLSPFPTIEGMSAAAGLSGAAIKPIAQFCLDELAGEPSLQLQLSAAGGVTCAQDAIEFLLLGARTVQVTTQIMLEGYGLIEDLRDGLAAFMEKHRFRTVEELVGAIRPKLARSSKELSRRQQLIAQIDADLCIGCGRCYLACRDGAYQAIEFHPDRTVRVDSEKCAGCGLCRITCPVPAAIRFTAKEEHTEGSA
ncbi:MAG: NAD-dependent dihydropyrimidine dehydrogenase subunit PreA [Coprothermobacterota bacterium]|nr:NAD-dependent dihydropyrimidine dehydrogenase subunit PreA [Coprothermobacterota bacterium]